MDSNFFGQCSQCSSPADGSMNWGGNTGHSYGVCIEHSTEKLWTIQSFDHKGRVIDTQSSWGKPQEIVLTLQRESGGYISFS